MSRNYTDKVDIEFGDGYATMSVKNKEAEIGWKEAEESLTFTVKGPSGSRNKITLGAESIAFLLLHLLQLDWLVHRLCDNEDRSEMMLNMGDSFLIAITSLVDELREREK